MSILIKGMEMPTSCISCLLNFGEKRSEYGLTIYCPYSDGVISWRDKAFDNGRLASCGIVSVPPHGRLIDADELRCLYDPHDYGLDGEQADEYDRYHVSLPVIRQNIDDMPTIIPAEEDDE